MRVIQRAQGGQRTLRAAAVCGVDGGDELAFELLEEALGGFPVFSEQAGLGGAVEIAIGDPVGRPIAEVFLQLLQALEVFLLARPRAVQQVHRRHLRFDDIHRRRQNIGDQVLDEALPIRRAGALESSAKYVAIMAMAITASKMASRLVSRVFTFILRRLMLSSLRTAVPYNGRRVGFLMQVWRQRGGLLCPITRTSKKRAIAFKSHVAPIPKLHAIETGPAIRSRRRRRARRLARLT